MKFYPKLRQVSCFSTQPGLQPSMILACHSSPLKSLKIDLAFGSWQISSHSLVLGHAAIGQRQLNGTRIGIRMGIRQVQADPSLPVSPVATSDTTELVMGRGTASSWSRCWLWVLRLGNITCILKGNVANKIYDTVKRMSICVKYSQCQHTETSSWIH